ncbi:MAG: protein kinase [Gemmatimonadaceae bacterium]
MADQIKDSLQKSLGDGFRVTRELGGGGMSRVFVVEDVSLQRETVVKVLHPNMPGATNVERFRREIHLAATLSHPHIVPLLAAGETDGLPYFTMPFVKGESLRAKLSREGELPVAEAVHVLRDVALALAHAHSNGVVHRDIKPENILMTGGSAVVTDFGVAKALDRAAPEASLATSSGFALGTPAYMAPEQAAADPHVDHRADIYAFGVVAYELLTGEAPFRGQAQQILAAHAMQEPEALDRRRRGIPIVLANLVMRCLAKRPADRPQSATELVTTLDSVASTSSAGAPNTRARRSYLRPLLFALPVLALLGSVAWYALDRSSETDAEAPKSVAVLPFVNLGGGQSDEYFSDGITDELTSALARIEGLGVASRTSAFSFKGRSNVDTRAVGRALNVGAVLEGTVRRSGDRLKVSAQLSNTSDGFILWSETYERRGADVFDVQEDIARSIAAALRIQLSAGKSLFTGTRDSGAHDLYLRGRFAWNRRSAAELKNAIAYFEEAIAKDPGFARAYSGLAESYVLLPIFDGRTSGLASWQRAKAAALKALQLDPMLVEAQSALAYGYGMHEGNAVAADEAFRRAIRMNPRYATAHQWYADHLASRGQLERSLAEMRVAQALDPLSLQINYEIARGLYFLRRYDESIQHLNRSVKTDSAFAGFRTALGVAYMMKGDHTRALENARLAVPLSGGRPIVLGRLAAALAHAGQTGEARDGLRDLQRRAREGEALWFPIALAATALGERDLALGALEKSAEMNDAIMYEFTFDPALDPLRSDPRFIALWRKMGLPPSSPDWR